MLTLQSKQNQSSESSESSNQPSEPSEPSNQPSEQSEVLKVFTKQAGHSRRKPMKCEFIAPLCNKNRIVDILVDNSLME